MLCDKTECTYWGHVEKCAHGVTHEKTEECTKRPWGDTVKCGQCVEEGGDGAQGK